METRDQLWYIIRCYFAPDDILMTESVVAVLTDLPRGSKLLTAGGFNVDLVHTESAGQDEETVSDLAADTLEAMLAQFIPRRRSWCWDRRMCSIVCMGREVRSWEEYIMGIYRRLLRNMSIRDPMHNSDHYIILGCLHITTLREHTKYLGLPLQPLITPMREDRIFTVLRREITNPKVQE